MGNYINREEILERFDSMAKLAVGDKRVGVDSIRAFIENAPAAADVEPVRHGMWEGTADGYADGELVYDMWACSECGFDADGAEEKPEWKYCPNCGAKMDGGDDDEKN